ncbi:hypothetical protein [Olivibacter domesticus]|uniref:Uncharacterized protein n=1 Tax=Olivibacter domesticus TaxID=407022 RepID=A0A1H7IDM5_OLID1|nr:hypothetical protein [Olivibacter domesticus]SEK60631.1 hypothetical protein SAMN05661044_00668 [Olivibacter domesticus]
MKIEIRNIVKRQEPFPDIKIAPRKGELYINNIHVGGIIFGKGFTTCLEVKDTQGVHLIKQAGDYLRQLPAVLVHPEAENTSSKYFYPSLENEIDRQLSEYREKEAAQQELTEMVASKQDRAILTGAPEKACKMVVLTTPIALMLTFPTLRHQLIALIQQKVLRQMQEGDRLLNTNIPLSVLKAAGLKPSQYPGLSQESEQTTSVDKSLRPKRYLRTLKPTTMKIEVKDICYQQPHPKARLSFLGQLYINDTHVGACMNSGLNFPTRYTPKDENAATLIGQAEAYCKRGPFRWINGGKHGTSTILPNDLHFTIDDEVYRFVRENERAKLIKIEQIDAIVVGTSRDLRLVYVFPERIDEILSKKSQWDDFAETLREKVLPRMEEREKLLNNNIPEIILQKAGLQQSQYTQPTVQQAYEEKSRRRGHKPG